MVLVLYITSEACMEVESENSGKRKKGSVSETGRSFLSMHRFYTESESGGKKLRYLANPHTVVRLHTLEAGLTGHSLSSRP